MSYIDNFKQIHLIGNDLVMYTNSTSSFWASKNLYITSGRMGKYKEDDEE